MDIVGDDVQDILDAIRGDGETVDPSKVSANDLPVGFAGLVVTSMATLTTNPIRVPISAYLRPDRLLLGQASCVALVRVTDVKVGTISLNIGENPIPAEAFRYDAVGTRLRAAVTASPSVPPIVSIYNGTGGTIIAEGGIFGPAKRA